MKRVTKKKPNPVSFRQDPKLKGLVTGQHTIELDNEQVDVLVVKWSGNPSRVPLMYRDEAGTNKKGYLPSDLIFDAHP